MELQKRFFNNGHIGSAIGGLLVAGPCVKIALNLKKENFKKQLPLFFTALAGVAAISFSQMTTGNNAAQQKALRITTLTAGLISAATLGVFNFLSKKNRPLV